MNERVVILGAAFGGLQRGAMPPEAPGDKVALTLIDRGDAFVVGFSKLDVRCKP